MHHPSHAPRPPSGPGPRSTVLAALAAIALLATLAIPVLAKEGLQATLDGPIAIGTPPGTEILVGVLVQVPTEDGLHPVDGSPIHLLLTGRDGTVTRAAGAYDGRPGHYTMRATIPPGGVRKVEVVMHGTSDLPLRLMADPLAFGAPRAGTAQVAPSPTPKPTPWPRVSAGAAEAAAGQAGTEVSAAPAPAPPPGPGMLPLAIVAAGVAAAVILVARRLRWTGAARGSAGGDAARGG